MQSENIKEYGLIRTEMIEVKDCMTRYMGFVLGGSGAALFGLSALQFSTDNFFALAYTSSFLSIIITFVLLILFYKFTSHNRFAGYCKLLNHERFSQPNECNLDHLYAWEMCIGRLRHSDIIDAKLLVESLKDIEIGDLEENDKTILLFILANYSGRLCPLENNKYWRGLWLIICTMFGKLTSKSWGYPPFVVSLLFLLCFGFLSTGCFGTVSVWLDGSINNESKLVLMMIMVLIILFQIIAWRFFSGKLFSIMNGSGTVDAFFLRFIPIRAHILNQFGIIPIYHYLDNHLEEANTELTKAKSK